MSPDPTAQIAALAIEPTCSALEAALLLGRSYSWLDQRLPVGATLAPYSLQNGGAGRMNDVYIIESWFGERRNLRQVYAADADDALQTHELHYPGEHIVSVQRGDGLSVR
jgi:hypothetical protein